MGVLLSYRFRSRHATRQTIALEPGGYVEISEMCVTCNEQHENYGKLSIFRIKNEKTQNRKPKQWKKTARKMNGQRGDPNVYIARLLINDQVTQIQVF